MRSFPSRWLAAALLVAAVFAAPLQAADSPVAGTWKMTFTAYPPGVDLTPFLLQLDVKDGKPTATVTSPIPDFKDSPIEDLKLTDTSLALTVKAGGRVPIVYTLNVPKGEKAPKQLVGTAEFRGQRMLARLDRTEDKEISDKQVQVPAEGARDLQDAVRTKDPAAKLDALKKVLEKVANSPLNLYAQVEMVNALAGTGAAEADVRAQAAKAIKLAETYGPAMKEAIQARTVAAEAAGLKARIAALKKDGKPEDLKAAEERLDKIEKQLDQEYLKTAIPFEPEKFTGRRGKSTRVAVYELFTGAECPPCVAADVAFDALLDTFGPKDVVFLQYHLHVPGPDPLTNKDNETRAEFYEVQGTPTAFLDGKTVRGQGGPKAASKESYETAVGAIKKALEDEAGAKLTLNATRKGDAIEIQADVADLKKPGEDVKLRLVLVEEVVRYPGGNGQRFHHHVVRAFPGGLDGLALKEATAKQSAKVNLGELAKDLRGYLDKYNQTDGPFPNDDRPLELKKLKVVALVQNDKTREILQAAQADIAEAK